uniref:Family with sequence similarity 124B n=1 Tax=Amphilophus citrinellus TaxID=61819 RepID=A0A3Q0RKJ2_AMPCI
MHLHLLANPGDSLLLQHTLDRLLRWLCPSLRIFHVSERASPFRTYPRYPSLAITFFLHEAYGEERILKVLDFFQRPPWHYHHTESCGSRTGGIHITSTNFYSLGAGMPVWGVRPVHCGGEILRVTLYSAYDNYEDAVRLYETVLQRQAEEQKAGFCWFTLHMEPGLCLQLALKQLSPGVRVEPCSSAVLQFSVEEIGQLVPLLPNPCTPISATRWQTEDLDGNKVLFQVTAGDLLLLSAAPFRDHYRGLSFSILPYPYSNQPTLSQRPRSDPVLEKLHGGSGGAESLGSGSCCSTPPGSSCYSSQRSSPAPLSTSNHPDSPLRPSIAHSLSHRLLEEDEEEPETNVDTGAPVSPRSDTAVKVMARSSSVDFLVTFQSERPAAVGASAVEDLAKELSDCLPGTHTNLQGPSGTWGSDGGTDAGRTVPSPSNRSLVENRTAAEPAHTNGEEPLDEFFI